MSQESPLKPLDEPARRVNPRLISRKAFFFYGALLGVLLVLGIRFATYSPAHTHYHANFAVYINGQRQEFKDSKYYQEVAACAAYDDITPIERAHMHNNENSVVHVHDHAVTWGQFFENLGWYVGDDFIKTDKQLYVANGDSKLHIIINGQDYTDISSITNTVIKDDDQLLVSFGDLSRKTIKQEYASIEDTAKHHDEVQDPASCSGHESPGFLERLKHLL